MFETEILNFLGRFESRRHHIRIRHVVVQQNRPIVKVAAVEIHIRKWPNSRWKLFRYCF